MIKFRGILLALAATLVAAALPSSARAIGMKVECSTRECIAQFQECSAEITTEFTDCIAETTKLTTSTAECYAFLTEAGLENQGNFRACVEEGDCEEECPTELAR